MSQKIRTLIVDDEELSISNLKFLLTEFCPQIQLVGTATNFKSAKKILDEEPIELAFLDVQFGTKNIFEFLETISPIHFSIIFVSAHNHALKAFLFDAVDYLVKPVAIELLQKAVAKIHKRSSPELQLNTVQEATPTTNKSETTEKIALATTDGYEIIATKDIFYFTANGSYTNVYLCEGRKIISSKNLKFFENLISESEFIRIHNSNLINKDYVKKIFKSEGGFVVMSNNKKLAISASRKNEVFKVFGLIKTA